MICQDGKANVELKDGKGKTAKEYAEQTGNRICAEIITYWAGQT